MSRRPRRKSKSKSSRSRGPRSKSANPLDSTHLHYWGLNYYQDMDKPLVHHVEIPNDQVAKIFLGENHLLVKTKKKHLYGYGDNSMGQFGVANKSKNLKAVPVSFFPKISIAKITCGCDFTYIVAKDYRKVYSWGFNCKGQLGQGHFDTLKSPCEVPLYRKNGSHMLGEDDMLTGRV